MGLPPIYLKGKGKERIVEVLDDGESLFGDEPKDKECVHLPRSQMDINYNMDEYGCRTTGVFDNHYDPRQVISSISDSDANDYSQSHQYVAYSSHITSCKVPSLDCKNISKDLFANCVKCKKEKTVQFIADSGASNTFTFDKSDFLSFKKTNGSIQTADKGSVTNFFLHHIFFFSSLYSVP